jgi:hypothetical protein
MHDLDNYSACSFASDLISADIEPLEWSEDGNESAKLRKQLRGADYQHSDQNFLGNTQFESYCCIIVNKLTIHGPVIA